MNYQERMRKLNRTAKIVVIVLVSILGAICLLLSLFLLISQYDKYTNIAGVICLIMAIFSFLGLVGIIKFWKWDRVYKDKYQELEKSREEEKVKTIEEEIEEIKRKNNL